MQIYPVRRTSRIWSVFWYEFCYVTQGIMYKVVWAIDPFDFDSSGRNQVLRVFEALLERNEAWIQPVHILSQPDLVSRQPHREGSPSQLRLLRYQSEAIKMTQQCVSSLHLKEVKKAKILLQSFVHEKGVSLISDFAHSKGADVILVHTHGRSGFSRLILGSFTETLILKSKVPVLVLGPHIQSERPVDRITGRFFQSILFPTAFDENSKIIFRRVVSLGKMLHSRLILYHSIPHPIESLLQSGVNLLGGGNWIPMNYYFNARIDRQIRRARCWTRWATHQGVPSDFVIDSYSGLVAESIVELAKKRNLGLIAMEEQAGLISATLIGSVTRQVIRTANCPVWVIRASMPWDKSIESYRSVA